MHDNRLTVLFTQEQNQDGADVRQGYDLGYKDSSEYFFRLQLR